MNFSIPLRCIVDISELCKILLILQNVQNDALIN